MTYGGVHTQNRARPYLSSHRFHLVTKSLVLLLTLVLAGCPLSSDDDNDTTVGSDVLENTMLELTVVDDEGAVLSDVTLASESVEIISQATDAQSRLQVEMKPSDQSAVLRVSKTGFDDALIYLPNLQSSSKTTAMLKARLPAIDVNINTGGDFSGLDGARVVVGADSFVNPDGSPANGQVELFINTVDTTDASDLASFPGSFLGLAAADTEPGILASLGVTSYRFEQNGEKLQLKEGEVAQLTLPLYAGEYEDGTPIPLGDLIPIWRLNEETGIWEEESTGVVVAMASSPTGLGLQGSTSHFSSFNADIWGRNSDGFGGGQAGPAGQSRQLPQTCRVSVVVPEFEDGTRYNARVVMNLGVLASTRPISGIYYEPFSFPVFQGRPASLRLAQPSYNDNEGRSLVKSFTCNAETMELLVQFEDVPAFFSVEAETEVGFDIVNGVQTVVTNTLNIRANFINDSDDLVQITTNLGTESLVPNGQVVSIDYFFDDPDPAAIAFYLENELGEADTQLLVDYVSEAPPSVIGTYANREDGETVFRWHGAEGADTVSLYQYDLGTDQLGVVVSTDINASTSEGQISDFAYDLPGGWYIMIFSNQYGEREEPVFLSDSEDCDPFSDLPCAA